MKKKIIYSLLLVFTGFVMYIIYVINNPVSPLETVTFQEDNKDISITYSRPYKKNRLIFGNESDNALVPYNNYWRTGANRHTMIKTKSDLSIGNNTLKSGEYSMYTIPGENSWDVTFNSTNEYFGIMRPDPEKDIFTVTVPSQNFEDVIEQFTIDFIPSPLDGPESNAIRLRWDQTEVVIPFN